MNVHKNARTTPFGRAVMVRRVLEDGWTVAAAAAAFAVSVRTVRKWLARFRRVGHRITGDRRGQSEGAGWEFVHVAVEDASRLAYVEVLPDEKRQSVTGFLVRALRYFKGLGIRLERVMTDNGSGYVSRLFRKACRMLRLRHIRTRPYTPKTNGKAERFIQTPAPPVGLRAAVPQLRHPRGRAAQVVAHLQP
jgi:transposase InsO family protein